MSSVKNAGHAQEIRVGCRWCWCCQDAHAACCLCHIFPVLFLLLLSSPLESNRRMLTLIILSLTLFSYHCLAIILTCLYKLLKGLNRHKRFLCALQPLHQNHRRREFCGVIKWINQQAQQAKKRMFTWQITTLPLYKIYIPQIISGKCLFSERMLMRSWKKHVRLFLLVSLASQQLPKNLTFFFFFYQ